MNAAVRAAVRCAIDLDMKVYGIGHGFEGLMDGEIDEMNRRSVGDILHRGGTVLKTARSERFKMPEGIKRAKSVLDTFGIEGLVVIGGGGTLRGGMDLSGSGVPVIFLPGTIDNDLGYTDFTIGFDTAVNTVLDAVSKIRDTSSSHERTTLIEVMGRACGDIALYAGLAGGAEYVLVPEIESNINELCKKILIGMNRNKQHSIIIKAEGVPISARKLVHTIKERTGIEARLVVLSYLQRGGSPSSFDRVMATLMGAKAAGLLKKDSASKALGIVNGNIIAYDLEEAFYQKKELNMEMYKLIDVLSK